MQDHLGETDIRIGETELSRVCGSGYVKRTQWRRIDQIGGAKFDFEFWTYLEEKVAKGFGAVSLSTLSK